MDIALPICGGAAPVQPFPAYRRLGCSRLLKRALQRVLILAGEVHHLIDLCLGDFVAEYPAYTHAQLMDVKHDAGRLFNVHLEKAMQDEDDELNRSIIIVQRSEERRVWNE